MDENSKKPKLLGLDNLFKTASTAMSRNLAKKAFGMKPKYIARSEYEIAKKMSGKEGREAFRGIKSNINKGSRGEKLQAISSGDPLGLRKDQARTKSQGEYAAKILKEKIKSFSRAQGPKDSKGRLKGTISKDQRITRHNKRYLNVSERGVGDLNMDTAKERKAKRAIQKKEYQESEAGKNSINKSRAKKGKISLEKIRKAKELKNTPEYIKKRKEFLREKERLRSLERTKNLTPEQRKLRVGYSAKNRDKQSKTKKEEIRASQRVNNMTPEKVKLKRERQAIAARKYRAEKKQANAMTPALPPNFEKKSSFLGLDDLFSKEAKEKYFAYRNIHKGKGSDNHNYSLRNTKSGRVEKRGKSFILKDVDFKVSEKGRERVRREKRKNVHAGVTGNNYTGKKTKDFKWERVGYNPYNDKGFTRADGSIITSAPYAKLTRHGVFIEKVAALGPQQLEQLFPQLFGANRLRMAVEKRLEEPQGYNQGEFYNDRYKPEMEKSASTRWVKEWIKNQKLFPQNHGYPTKGKLTPKKLTKMDQKISKIQSGNTPYKDAKESVPKQFQGDKSQEMRDKAIAAFERRFDLEKKLEKTSEFKSHTQRRKFYALKAEGKMDQATIDEWEADTPKNIPKKLEKIAKEKNEKRNEIIKGSLLGLGGKKILEKAIPDLTGRTSYYHGTDKDAAKNIIEKGFDADKKGLSFHLSNHDAFKDPESGTYVTKSKKIGKGYGRQKQALKNTGYADILNDVTLDKQEKIRAMARAQQDPRVAINTANPMTRGKVVTLSVPEWKKKLKKSPNPEMLGATSLLDYIKKRQHEFDKSTSYIDKNTNKVVNAIDSAANYAVNREPVIKGTISPELIKGHPSYTKLGLGELKEYATKNKGKFGKGIGLGMLGVGTLGYGANKVYNQLNKTAGGPGSGVEGDNTAKIDMPMTPNITIMKRTAFMKSKKPFVKNKKIQMSSIKYVGQEKYVPKKLNNFIEAVNNKESWPFEKPIDVTIDSNGDYAVLDGHHRYLTSKHFEKKTIQANVYLLDEKLDEGMEKKAGAGSYILGKAKNLGKGIYNMALGGKTVGGKWDPLYGPKALGRSREQYTEGPLKGLYKYTKDGDHVLDTKAPRDWKGFFGDEFSGASRTRGDLAAKRFAKQKTKQVNKTRPKGDPTKISVGEYLENASPLEKAKIRSINQMKTMDFIKKNPALAANYYGRNAVQKSLTLGFPALAIHDAASGTAEAADPKSSRLGNTMGSLAEGAGWSLVHPLGFAGSLAAVSGLKEGAKTIGNFMSPKGNKVKLPYIQPINPRKYDIAAQKKYNKLELPIQQARQRMVEAPSHAVQKIVG